MAGTISAAIIAFTGAAGATASAITIATQFAVTAAAAAGINALSPQPKTSMGSQLDMRSGAISPTTMLAGRIATAGTRLTDLMRTGKDNIVGSIVTSLSAVGLCGDVESVKWGDDTLTFDGSGNCTSPSKYIGAIWLKQSSGSWTQSALNWAGVGHSSATQPSEWGTNHRALGCKLAVLIFRLDKDSVWKENWHNPIFVVNANQVPLIDPRTGTAATGDALNNPWVWYYNYAQKFTSSNGTMLAGFGWELSQSDIAQIQYCANVADVNGWKISGQIEVAADDGVEILKGIAQTGGGQVATRGGLLSATIAAPKVSIATILEDDFASDLSWRSNYNALEVDNTIVPRFISEDNKWQVVDGTPITDASFLTADGGFKRTQTLELKYVSNPTQAGQLAAYALVNSREPFNFTLPLKAQAKDKANIGDCVTLGHGDWVGQKVTIVDKITNSQDFSVTYIAISETDSKHPWALGKTTTAPDYTSQTRQEASYCPAPSAGAWTVSAELNTSDGTQLPILVITGASDFYDASAILFKIKVEGDVDWKTIEQVSPTTLRYEIRGLTPATSYVVGVSYLNRYGIEGATTLESAITTGGLIAGSIGVQPDNLIPSAQPLYLPSNPSAGYLGSVISEKWELVQDPQSTFGLAMWKYDLANDLAWSEFRSPEIIINQSAVISAKVNLARIGTWTSGDVGAAIEFFSNTEYLGRESIGWALDGELIEGYPDCYEVKRENISVPIETTYFQLIYGVSGGVGTGSAGVWRAKVNKGATCALWSDEATLSWLWGAKLGTNVSDETGNTINDVDVITDLNPKLGTIEEGAQVQINISGLVATTFDFVGGVVVSGQLPRAAIQARAYRAGVEITTDISGTWSIENIVNCTVSIGAHTGIESITALAGGGNIERSYVRRFTYGGKFYDQKVTIVYNSADSAIISSKAGVPRTFGNSIVNSTWADIATNGVMSITDCPDNGVVTLTGGVGFVAVSGNNADINLRLKIDGSVVYTSNAQTAMTGGILDAVDFSDIFGYLHTTLLSAGTHTFSVEAQRVSGDGVVSTTGNLFVTVTGT